MARKLIPFRHVDETGKVFKVEWDPKTRKQYIAGTDTELQHGQYTHKKNLVYDATGKFIKISPGRYQREHRMDYDEWWQQSNLDGTFAYNNSANDF